MGDESGVGEMIFRLDERSGVPTYLQIVHQVEHAIRLGYLVRGDQLPRVKDVVVSLNVNPNTVLKAYRHLEQKGLTMARAGQGTFVTASPQTVALEDLTILREDLIEGWLARAAALGLGEDEIVGVFMGAVHTFFAVLEHSDAPSPRRRGARAGGELA